MTYEELKISLDINDPIDVLAIAGRPYADNKWLVVCDEGDCHLFNEHGKEIGCFAFSLCKNLKNIEIPDNVHNIKKYTFDDCTRLESIDMPCGVETIGFNAFNGCCRLKKIVFKDKTIEQVKAMQNYPWGIKDESAIKCRS